MQVCERSILYLDRATANTYQTTTLQIDNCVFDLAKRYDCIFDIIDGRILQVDNPLRFNFSPLGFLRSENIVPEKTLLLEK